MTMSQRLKFLTFKSQVPQSFGQRQSITEEEHGKNHSNLDYSLSLEKNDAQSEQVLEQQHRGSDVEVIQFAASNFNFEKTKNDNFRIEEEYHENQCNAGPKESEAPPNYQNVYSNNSQHNENHLLNQVNPYKQEQQYPLNNQQYPGVKTHPNPKVNNFQTQPHPVPPPNQYNPLQGQIIPQQQQPPPNLIIDYQNLPQNQNILPTQYASPFNGYYQQHQVMPLDNNGQHKKKKKRRDDDSDSEGRRCRHNQGYVQPAVIVPMNCRDPDPIAVNLSANVLTYCCLGLFNRNDNCCQWICDCLVYLLTFPIQLFKKLIDCTWGCCMKDLCSASCPKCHDGCTQGCGILVSTASRCCGSLKFGANDCCMQLLNFCCSCINFATLGTYLAENCRKFWKDSGALISSCTGAIGSCCLVFGDKFADCCCFITGQLSDCMGAFMKMFGDVICKLCELFGECIKAIL